MLQRRRKITKTQNLKHQNQKHQKLKNQKPKEREKRRRRKKCPKTVTFKISAWITTTMANVMSY